MSGLFRPSRRAMLSLLRQNGHIVQAVSSAELALAAIQDGMSPSVMLVDLDLPGMSGVELIGELQKSNPGIQSILITAADTERVRVLMAGRVVRHLRKPIEFNDLLLLLGTELRAGAGHP